MSSAGRFPTAGRAVAAFGAGALTVLGFAPFGLFPLPWLTLALLFVLWHRATTARQGALLGLCWGLGCFLVGVSWVYVSLHDVGGMAWPLAAVSAFAFCAILAPFPALAGYGFVRWRPDGPWRSIVLAAGLWTLAEWLRGWVLTGFPWLAVGYSQTPPSPLAGYAPIVGVYGVGLATAFVAALMAWGWRKPVAIFVLTGVLMGGATFRWADWTRPAGEPLNVSLLQGNIPQSLKWEPEHLALSLQTYLALAKAHPAPLIVLPETAIPLLFDQIPADYLAALGDRTWLLMGTALRTPDKRYLNGAVALDAGRRQGEYGKAHLVPFGEYVPPGFDWFFRLVRIPMSDFTPGPAGQPPLAMAGQQVLPNICYEDLFGEDIAARAADATLLINLSNTAWFGHSLAQPQHLQIARMRALETGRPMLRATNTGMTAAIDPKGEVTAVLPPFTADGLTVTVQGRTGRTPYLRMGNLGALALAILAVLLGRRRATKAP